MESFAKLHCRHQPLHLSLNPHRPFFSKPISSFSLRTSKSPLSSTPKLPSIRASSSPVPSLQKPAIVKTLTPILKTACVTLTAAAALFFAGVSTKLTAIAAPTSVAPTVETEKEEESKENVPLQEQERMLEEQLESRPKDFEVLKSLMEVKIRSRKLHQATEVIDRLIELDPEEPEWPLLKAQIFSYSGDLETAKQIFEEILQKDPFRVEAYHGLVMVNTDAGEPLKDILKRIEVAMEKCKKEKKNSDLRDFRLLVAQVRVMEEKYNDALKMYEELVKEEPRDFRPYLCQGIIYTILKKKNEAEQKFEQFRKLVPENHPYREYFLDNMFATKFFAEKMERERS